jgi:hypothetical protein
MPKDRFGNDRDWGIGQRADGSICIMTMEEALLAIVKRDREEAAIADAMEQVNGEDLDDVSDLDEPGESRT